MFSRSGRNPSAGRCRSATRTTAVVRTRPASRRQSATRLRRETQRSGPGSARGRRSAIKLLMKNRVAKNEGRCPGDGERETPVGVKEHRSNLAHSRNYAKCFFWIYVRVAPRRAPGESPLPGQPALSAQPDACEWCFGIMAAIHEAAPKGVSCPVRLDSRGDLLTQVPAYPDGAALPLTPINPGLTPWATTCSTETYLPRSKAGILMCVYAQPSCHA